MLGEISNAVRQDASLGQAVSRLADVLSHPMLTPPRLTADVFETPDGTAYTVEVPAPRLSADELIVSATSDMLTVETQPRLSTDGQGRAYLVQEVPRERMARVFTFPATIDVDNIEARREHGVLRIRVPKAEGARSRVIPVQGIPTRGTYQSATSGQAPAPQRPWSPPPNDPTW
jgi:HSP20 family protein